jgi:glycosyltransferase involved in cell wall biosynthesis
VGWLIPMKDRAALTRAIREVIADPIRVGKAARQHVMNGFSKELRITRLESLYREILAKNKWSGGPSARRGTGETLPERPVG